mgnify:CR=1 FL=1
MKAFQNLFLTFSNNSKKRIKKNLISQISLNIFLVVIQILFPPLMIIIYGLDNFGIWVFLTAIPYAFSILDFNLNLAARIEMSIFYNKKKTKNVDQIFTNSSVLTFFFVSILALSLFILFNYFDFNFDILNSLNKNEISFILYCIIVSFLINILNNIFKTALTYKGKLDLDVYIEIFSDFLSKFLILLIGIIFKNLLFAALALLIATILKIIIYYFYFLTSKTELSFNLKYLSKNKIFKLLKLSTSYYFETVSGILKNSYQIIILGIFFTPQIVGLVSTLKTLFYFFPIRIWGIVAKAIFYEFTRLYSIKNFNLLKTTYSNYLKIGLVYTLLLVIFSLIFGKLIYSLWLNNSYELNYVILFLLILDTCIFIFVGSVSFINKSIKKFFKITFFQVVINILIIIIAYSLFNLNYSYMYLFICNLIGSILILIFCVISAINLIKERLQ